MHLKQFPWKIVPLVTILQDLGEMLECLQTRIKKIQDNSSDYKWHIKASLSIRKDNLLNLYAMQYDAYLELKNHFVWSKYKINEDDQMRLFRFKSFSDELIYVKVELNYHNGNRAIKNFMTIHLVS